MLYNQLLRRHATWEVILIQMQETFCNSDAHINSLFGSSDDELEQLLKIEHKAHA